MKPLSKMQGSYFEEAFFHESVRVNRDAMYRARILVLLLLVAIPAMVPVSGILVLWAPMELQAFFLTLNIGALIAMPTMLYILKRYGHVDFCCSLAVILALVAIGIVIVATGGAYLSPARQLLFLPCLMSFLFGGVRMGAVTAAICLMMLVGMLVTQESGYAFLPVSHTIFSTSGNMAILAINFVLASALAFSYEYTAVSLRHERDQEYQKFLDLARTDPLTGLANRRIFDEALHSKVDLYERMPSKPCFVLCYLDLDKFKPINDNYGHDIGDEVLSVVSNRLLSALRGADFIGRHGGDEFMILFDGVQSVEAMNALAARLQQLIREPIQTQAGTMEIDASLGFSTYPQHGHDVISLRAAADAAMYEAKRTRSGFRIFQQQSSSH